MKILLDECVNRRLALLIEGHDVSTVAAMGWTGVKNGALLARAGSAFDAFVTLDQGIAFQHDVSKLPLAVIVVRARTNRLADLAPLVPDLLRLLEQRPPRGVHALGPV